MDVRENYFKILTLADNSLPLPVGKNKKEFAYIEGVYCFAFFALLDLDVERENIDNYVVIKDYDRIFSLEKDNVERLKNNGFDQVLFDDERNDDNYNPLNKRDLSDTSMNYTERRANREENPDLYDEKSVQQTINDDDSSLDDDFELQDFEEDLDQQVIDKTEVQEVQESKDSDDFSEQKTNTDDFEDEDDFLELEEDDELEFVDEPDFSEVDNEPLEFVDSDMNIEMDDGIDGGGADNENVDDDSRVDRDIEADNFNSKDSGIGPIMPYSMHQSDFTYSAVRVSITEFGQSTDVKLLVTPLRIDIDTPDILVDAITRNGTKVYISDDDKKVVASIDGYDIIISGYMDDGGIFNVSVYVDGVDEDNVQIKTTYNDSGLKGHTMAYDNTNNVVIHVVPIGKSNNSSGFADFVYYINNDGKQIYGDTSDNSNSISFDVKGEEYNLKATWDKDNNFILSLT